MTQTIEQLQAKNAELTAEVERLKTTPPYQRQDLHCVVSDISAECRELRQQLAIAEAQNARLREALEQVVNGADECLDDDGWIAMVISMEAYHICDEALSLPASRETLDKYVADAIELERTARQQAEALLHKQAETISVLTRQRDLAISAATKARNGAQQCASVCSKHLDVYPALLNMIDVVDGALATIKESEV